MDDFFCADLKHKLTIAIAGCGVAGLASAALLARAGHRVVQFDKLDAPAPVGSGLILQPVGMHVLDAIGAGEAMRALGARIERLYGRNVPGDRIVLDVRYACLGAKAGQGLAVHRGALFEALLKRAQEAGAAFELKRDVRGISGGRLVFADGTQSALFDLVIDALGARSALSRPGTLLPYGALWASLDWPAAGFDAFTLEQRYQQARKMAGVLPIGKLSPDGKAQAAFFWSLKHDQVAAWRAAPLAAWKHQVRGLWPATAPFLDQIRAHDDLVFAAYAHRTLASPLSCDVVHVGDSWHCTSPQLGQGANMALLDAYALAHALESQDDLAIALGEYERLRLWHIRLYQAASFLFTPAYQSDSAAMAWVRDWIVSPLARVWPAPLVLAALVAGAWGWPLGSITNRR